MELLSRDIPEAGVMEARKKRKALLDKFPSDDQSDAEEVLEPSVADLSRKEMLAKTEEMMALDTTQSSEEIGAQVQEWKRDVLEQAQVSRKKRSSDASGGQLGSASPNAAHPSPLSCAHSFRSGKLHGIRHVRTRRGPT